MYYDFQENPDQVYTEAYLFHVITGHFAKNEVLRIKDGLQMAAKSHRNQLRSDGSPYIVHPMRVALLLLKYESTTTSDIFIAALLHDALEDSALTEEEVEKSLGEKVAYLVSQVTRYRPLNETHEQRKKSKLKKWHSIMNSKHESRLIKAYDYLDNMISWKFIPNEHPHIKKIPRWLMEAETMYLPLAEKTSQIAYDLIKKEMEYYLRKGYKIGNWYSDSR